MKDKDFNKKISKLLTEDIEVFSSEEQPTGENIAEPNVSSTPFAEVKPNVYGLSDDVFDTVGNTETPDEVADVEEVEVEVNPNDIDIDIEEPEEDSDEYIPGEEDLRDLDYGKKFASAEEEEQEVGDEAFNDVDDDMLLEYAERKGVEFTTRKRTIQTLFEHNRVTKEDLQSFKNIKRRQRVNESVLLIEEDSFIDKFGDVVDFRDINEPMTFGTESPEIYNTLDKMSQEEWEEYNNELGIEGVTISYDPSFDVYIVTPKEDETIEEELYEIEQEDKQIIENLVKDTPYTLMEVKGLPKSTKKDYIMEVVVRKDNYDTTIRYNDNKIIKPWSIGQNEFNTLKESLNNVIIPFKHLVKETAKDNKTQRTGPTLTEVLSKESKHLSKDLPLTIKEQREQRGKDMIKKMFKESTIGNQSQLDEFDTDEWSVEPYGDDCIITPGSNLGDENFTGTFEQLLVWLKNSTGVRAVKIESKTGEVPYYIIQQIENHGLEFIVEEDDY